MPRSPYSLPYYVNEYRRGVVFQENGNIYIYDKGYNYHSNIDSLNTCIRIPCDPMTVNLLYLSQSSDSSLLAFGKYYDFHPPGSITDGAFYSSDGGNNWISISNSSMTAAALSGNHIYLGKEDGDLVYSSKDGGITWSEILPEETDPLNLSNYGWYSRAVEIDVDPDNRYRFFPSYFDHSMDYYIGNHNFEAVGTNPTDWLWREHYWI